MTNVEQLPVWVEHTWREVRPANRVQAPDGTVWRVSWAPGPDWLGQPILENTDGARIINATATPDGVVMVAMRPVDDEDVALEALRRNFPNIEKISSIMDNLDQMTCRCTGLSHLPTCNDWRMPL